MSDLDPRQETGSGPGSRLPRWWAFVLVAVVLAVNPWTLGSLFAVDGTIDGLKLRLVQAFDLFVLLLAAFVGWGRFSLVTVYRDVALIGFNTLVLIAILNLAAFARFHSASLDHFYNPLEFINEFPDLAREIWDDPSIDSILERWHTDPGADGHPSLPFVMRPVRDGAHNFGPHGERVSCRDGTPVDAPLDGAIWMFGGSTTYGVGVADCETIASALNGLLPGVPVVNLGVVAFGRNPEVERLVLLLRQGYRPKAVVFLDGLNDLDINMLRAPLLPPHTVGPTIPHAYYHQVLGRTDVFVANLFGRMPLVSLLSDIDAPGPEDILPCAVTPLEAGIEQPGSDYLTRPLDHLARQKRSAEAIRTLPAESLSEEMLDRCARRAIELYATDQSFLEGLGRAFGFDVAVFFQPLGMLNPANPHTREPDLFPTLGWFRFLTHVSDAVRAEIAAGRLHSFTDLSDMGQGCGICYVDNNHYSPAFNREIATRMVAALRTRGTIR